MLLLKPTPLEFKRQPCPWTSTFALCTRGKSDMPLTCQLHPALQVKLINFAKLAKLVIKPDFTTGVGKISMAKLQNPNELA